MDKDTQAITQGPLRACLPTDAYGNIVEYSDEGFLLGGTAAGAGGTGASAANGDGQVRGGDGV